MEREKENNKICFKYQGVYSLENLAFSTFSQVIEVFPEANIWRETAESTDLAVSYWKRRACRFPCEHIAVMIPSQNETWVEKYTKLFTELSKEFVYIDFFIISVANSTDDSVPQVVFSYSYYEEDSSNWRILPMADAVNLTTWGPTKKLLRWFVIVVVLENKFYCVGFL